MKLSCWAMTIPGRRSENEDAVALPGLTPIANGHLASITVELRRHGKLVAVADGVGGRPEGRWAAETALEVLAAQELSDNSSRSLSEAIATANRKVSSHTTVGLGPATTLAGISASVERLLVFHVGDSRVYRIEETGAHVLTRDHRSRTDSRSITRYLGSDAHAIPSISEIELAMDAMFLVSSDGFHAFLRETDLLLFRELEPGKALTTLVDMALENGSNDNLSAIFLRFD